MNDNELEYQEIYAAFQPKILRYLERMVSADEAEDLAQETFVKVYQALGSFRGESKLSTWLYRIATNTALDRLRSPSYQRTDNLVFPDESIEDGGAELVDMDVWTGEEKPLVETQIFRQEMNDCIRSYIQKLPGDYRTVLVLSEFEGLKNKEIADVLGITLDAVKIRLHRAKEKLIKELESHCGLDWIEGNEFLPDFKRVVILPA